MLSSFWIGPCLNVLRGFLRFVHLVSPRLPDLVDFLTRKYTRHEPECFRRCHFPGEPGGEGIDIPESLEL